MKRTKKRLKIKWKNIALLIVLFMCVYLICHNLFMLTIYSWLANKLYGWTWLGFLTFLLAFAIGGEISEYFINEFKK